MLLTTKRKEVEIKMANVTTPEPNLITKDQLARVREIDFATQFNGSIKKLIEALGITRKIPKAAGTVLKTYKATGTLEDGIVAEGQAIPLSKYKTEAKTYKEITLKKWRKSTPAEAIIERGYDQAVNMTTARMVKDAQKGIRQSFFDSLKNEESATTAEGVGLQEALAQAWGKLQVLFEDDELQSVHFIHPEDAAEYLGGATITMQTAFGMTYIKDFLGLGTVFLNSSVEKDYIYSTASENIVLYYIAVNGADLGEAFEFTTDETGYIGIHEFASYGDLTAQTVMVSGIEFFPERSDGVVKTHIAAALEG